ncbi:MAG: 3D domain-containing protein [Chloroflexota bacterium]|nr:3D domain-containing protein [Chloroflexota bacterium]
MKPLLSRMANHRAGSSASIALMVAVVALALTTPATGVYGATLYRGDRVQVRETGGSGLNVRSYAGLSFSRVTLLEEGQVVTVVSGPIWRNGYGWYEVTGFDRAGSKGWSAGLWLYRVQRAAIVAAKAPSTQEPTRTTAAAPAQTRTQAASQPVDTSSGYRGRSYRVVASGYNGAEFRSTGIMANGQRVHWGAVAVDPRYIPLGTRMYISGFGGQVFVASDTGSAIKGWRIDIWFPSLAQARAFGMQGRTVTLIR